MTKSINALMIEALEKQGLPGADFEVVRYSADSSEQKLAEMAAYVAAVLDTEDEEDNPFDPLELKVYRADDGSFIADVLITCGGPTVTVRYESTTGKATVKYHWIHDYLEVSNENTILTSMIADMAAC